MTDVYSFTAGDAPLLISIPHDGRELMPGQADTMTAAGRRLPDTDWHVRRLYEFASGIGANVIAANYSRYVIDLNRPPSDDALYAGQLSTGLCPYRTFAGDDIYRSGARVPATEQALRVKRYWQPYHERIAAELARLRDTFSCALLWDAHSIAARVPMLFDGVLPDLNIGTDNGRSCAPALAQAVMQAAESSTYSAVLNGRFRGGFITRNYGKPEQNIHAIQLELAQHSYMDEKDLRYDAVRAAMLAATIRDMLDTLLAAAQRTKQDRTKQERTR